MNLCPAELLCGKKDAELQPAAGSELSPCFQPRVLCLKPPWAKRRHTSIAVMFPDAPMKL